MPGLFGDAAVDAEIATDSLESAIRMAKRRNGTYGGGET